MSNKYILETVPQGIIHIYSKLFMFMSYRDSRDFLSGRRYTLFLRFNVPLWIQHHTVQVVIVLAPSQCKY